MLTINYPKAYNGQKNVYNSFKGCSWNKMFSLVCLHKSLKWRETKKQLLYAHLGGKKNILKN